MKRLLAIMLASVLVISLIQISRPSAKAVDTVIGKVSINNNKDANVRSQASMEGTIVGVAKAGKQYDLLAEQTNWYKICLDSKTSGWIFSSTATVVSRAMTIPNVTPKPATEEFIPLFVASPYKVRLSYADVYSQPLTSAPTLTRLYYNECVFMSAISPSWAMVTTASGLLGYMSLDAIEPAPDVTLTLTPTATPIAFIDVADEIYVGALQNNTPIYYSPDWTLWTYVSAAERFRLEAMGGEWYRIRHLTNGRVAFVLADQFRMLENLAPSLVPVVTPTPTTRPTFMYPATPVPTATKEISVLDNKYTNAIKDYSEVHNYTYNSSSLDYANTYINYLTSRVAPVSSLVNNGFNLAQYKKSIKTYDGSKKQFIKLTQLEVISITDVSDQYGFPCELMQLFDKSTNTDYAGLRFGSSSITENTIIKEIYAIPLGWLSLNKPKTFDCMYVVFSYEYDAQDGIEATVVSQTALGTYDYRIITYLRPGTKVTITGYNSSLGRFTATYYGIDGYIQGYGLNVSRDYLLNYFQ